MVHAIWSGSLSFGLVNIPINLYSATKSEVLSFHLFRKKDFSPISYVRVARADGKEVPYDEIVKGYEYKKGDFVTLTDDDFHKADVKKTESIEIIDFVNQNEIDVIYFDKPYYIEPTRGAAKPYEILVESLKKSGKVGVAKFVMRNKEHIGIIRPEDKMLILEQLRFDDEIRSTKELDIPNIKITNNKEIDMAIKLIDQMTEHFNPKDYEDTYNDELLDVIKEKAKKGSIKPRGKEPKATNFTNLMTELKKSLKVAQDQK